MQLGQSRRVHVGTSTLIFTDMIGDWIGESANLQVEAFLGVLRQASEA